MEVLNLGKDTDMDMDTKKIQIFQKVLFSMYLNDLRFLVDITLKLIRVRNLKFATYLKFATCENTNKINEFW